MPIYDVSLITPGQVGGELYAHCPSPGMVGRSRRNADGGAQVFCDDAQKCLIAEAVRRHPRQDRLSVGPCLVQRRRDLEHTP